MTALPVTTPTPSTGPDSRRTSGSSAPSRPLRPLASPPPRMARLPFMAVLVALFGFGMAGLLLLNTTLQNQAFAARTLNRQASELTYVQADLEARLDSVSAPASLAQKASGLGLRANPYPAFLVVPDGRVFGRPRVVRGNEVPELIVRDPRRAAAQELDTALRAGLQTLQQAQGQVAADAAQARAEAAKKKVQRQSGASPRASEDRKRNP